MTVLLRMGGGGKGHSIKENITFYEPFFPTAKVTAAIKLEGGGGECLNALPLKKKEKNASSLSNGISY